MNESNDILLFTLFKVKTYRGGWTGIPEYPCVTVKIRLTVLAIFLP